MNRGLPIAAAILMLVVLLPMSRKPTEASQASSVELRPAWNRTMEARITDIRLSSTGRCVGISTDENIVVIDPTGRELWRWDFRKDNRFAFSTKIAVSPNCDWAAFVGGQGYHYVWFVLQRGTRNFVKTEGTPLTVDIDHAGKSVAIGTGAGFVLMYTPEGALKWKLDVGGPLPIQEIAFADDDRAIMVSSYGQAIVSAEGKRFPFTGMWGVGSMRAASDFKTFVAWGQPPHGPGIGKVSLLDGGGKEIWSRVATNPRAIISPAGDRIVVETNDNQFPSEADHFSPQSEELPRALRLLSRTGDVVRTYREHGNPIAFFSDGRSFVLHQTDGFLALDLNENPLWKISKSGLPLIASTTNLMSVVVAQENRLEWYSPPPRPGSTGR